MKLRIKQLENGIGLPFPRYAHEGDAGLDLYSTEEVTIFAGQRYLIGSGIAVEIPEGHVGLVFPKSGRGMKEGLSFVNAVGVIDSGYRGEIGLSVINHDSHAPIEITKGQKIGQLVVMPFVTCEIELVDDELTETSRGEGGFGSTGI
jgi:dUTP pyrophosphatase